MPILHHWAHSGEQQVLTAAVTWSFPCLWAALAVLPFSLQNTHCCYSTKSQTHNRGHWALVSLMDQDYQASKGWTL